MGKTQVGDPQHSVPKNYRRIRGVLALWGVLCMASLCVADPIPVATPAPVAAPAPAETAALETFVPDGFQGTIFVNVRQAADAPELDAVRNRLTAGPVGNVVNQIFMIAGVDLLKDLDGILVALPTAQAGKDAGLVLVRGRWDAEKLLGIVKSNPKYEETAVGTQTMYGFWSDKDAEMRYAAFPAQDVLAIGKKVEVQKAIGLTAGLNKARMTDQAAYQTALRAATAKDCLARLVVLPPPAQSAPNVVGRTLLESGQSLGLTLTIGNGLHLQGELTATSEDAARQWKDMVQGVLAFAQMQKQLPQAGGMAKRVVLAARGGSATASLDATLDEAGDLLMLIPAVRALGQGPAMQEPVGVSALAPAANPAGK